MSLRKHMAERHPHVKLPRSNADLEKAHANQHYRYSPNHHHEGGKGTGPSDRPVGWKTGEGVIEKRH